MGSNPTVGKNVSFLILDYPGIILPFLLDDDGVLAWGGEADDDAAWVGGFVDVEVNTTDDDTVGGTTGGVIAVGSPVNNGRYNNVQFHQFKE